MMILMKYLIIHQSGDNLAQNEHTNEHKRKVASSDL